MIEKYIALYFSGWLIGPIVLAGASMYAQSALEVAFSFLAVIAGNTTAGCLLFFVARFFPQKYLTRFFSFFRISEHSLRRISKLIEKKGLFLVLFIGYFLSPLAEFSLFVAFGMLRVRPIAFLINFFLSSILFGLIVLFGGLFFFNMITAFLRTNTILSVVIMMIFMVCVYCIRKVFKQKV